MTNKIRVSWTVWKEAHTRYVQYKKKNHSYPNHVTVQGNQVSKKDFHDSWKRVNKYKKQYGKKPKTVSLIIPDSPKPSPVTDKTILPVYQFNQQSINYDYGRFREYACGPTSSCIGASYFDLVSYKTFQETVKRCIINMYTKIGSGTAPQNMISGFNKVFTKLHMSELKFTETNIKKSVEEGKPMVANILTNPDFGYKKSRVGHYILLSGYKDGEVRISDPHGFNLGHSTAYWLSYNKVKNAVDNNGGKPLYVVSKK